MFPVRLWHLIGEPPTRVALRVGLAGLLAGAVLALATPARAQSQIWNATLTPALRHAQATPAFCLIIEGERCSYTMRLLRHVLGPGWID